MYLFVAGGRETAVIPAAYAVRMDNPLKGDRVYNAEDLTHNYYWLKRLRSFDMRFFSERQTKY